MTMNAIRIADVAYDAARRSFEAAVEFFAPGIPVPLRIGVRVPSTPDITHTVLVRGLVRAAERQILR